VARLVQRPALSGFGRWYTVTRVPSLSGTKCTHVEIELQTVGRLPCHDSPEINVATVAGPLMEASRCFEEEFALWILRGAVSEWPPFGYAGGKQAEGFIGGAAKKDGFLNHGFDNGSSFDKASSRASAVSQKSSMNSRTGVNPLRLIVYWWRVPRP